MKKRLSTIVTILALTTITRGVTNDLSGLLQRGLFEEEANRNIDAAISNYQALANSFDKDRQIAATAIFRLGECYRKLGRTNEAAAQYERIVNEFSDQQTLATMSQQNLAGLGVSARPGQNAAPATGSGAPVELQTALAKAEAEYAEKKSTLDMLNKLSGDNLKKILPTVITDDQLNRLSSELDSAEQNFIQVQSNQGEEHPQYKVAKTQVDELRHKIDDRISGILAGLQAQLDASKAYQDSLEARLAKAQSSNAGPARVVANAEAAPITDDEEKEIRRIQQMIQNSPDLINAPSLGVNGNRTPLFQATIMGWMRVATFLLDHGADPNADSGQEGRPLHGAAESGNKGMAELLLSRGADIDARADVGGMIGFSTTPLHIAAQKGFLAVAESLMAHKADVSARNSDGRTPLHLAVIEDRAEIVKALLAHGADVNAKDNSGQAPLYEAVKHNPRITSLLITAGADVNAISGIGEAPLSIAAMRGNTEIVKMLLEAKADPNGGMTNLPLIAAIEFGSSPDRTNICELLIRAGADPNRVAPVNKQQNWGQFSASPIQRAVVNRQPGIVNLLLDAGGDANTNSGWGSRTLLLQAAANIDAETARLLLAKGADVNARDKDGNTALHLAIGLESHDQWNAYPVRRELVELLLKNHANPNVQNMGGRTPLDLLMEKLQVPLNYYPQYHDIHVFAQELADLLRANGALDNLPDFKSIRVTRQSWPSPPQVVFRQSSNDWNQISLFDVLGVQYQLLSGLLTGQDRNFNHYGDPNSGENNLLPFPDLARIVIHRPVDNGATIKELKIDAAKSLGSGDCSADVPLQFGDIIEIPEADHVMGANWRGLATNELFNLKKCLTRHVDVTVKGKTSGLALAPDVEFGDPEGFRVRTGGAIETFYPVRLNRFEPFMLWPALRDSNVLLASSDLSRVQVKRHDAATGKTHEWTVDCSNPNSPPNFWLRDGDVIEVPEKGE